MRNIHLFIHSFIHSFIKLNSPAENQTRLRILLFSRLNNRPRHLQGARQILTPIDPDKSLHLYDKKSAAVQQPQVT